MTIQMYLHLILLTNNQPGNLQSMCLSDSSNYISKKANDLPVGPDEVLTYTVPVSNINDVKLNQNIISSKNELGEMWKRN